MYRLLLGDVLSFARHYKGEPFHALLCDAPYHLTSTTERFGKEGSAEAQYGDDGAFQRASKGFMGKSWDGTFISFQPETWEALGNLLYPGAFGMTFGGSRTAHRMAVAIEDAGFIILPMIAWITGQSFPKATNIHAQKLKDSFYSSVQGGLHLMEKVEDSQFDYPQHCHFCDGQLQSLEVAFPNDAPLLGDAQEYSHSYGSLMKIQADNEQRPVRLGQLFFRLSTKDYSRPETSENTQPSFPESIEPDLSLSSFSDNEDSASESSCEKSAHKSASKRDFLSEHEQSHAQILSRKQDKQISSDCAELTGNDLNIPSDKNDGLVSKPLPPDEIVSHTNHKPEDEEDIRYIPNLTLPKSLEPPQDLLYTHYTHGCLSCQIEFYNDALRFSGHRYGMQVLKNAVEPIIVFQKPYEGRPVDSITKTGAGALNIDGSRIGGRERIEYGLKNAERTQGVTYGTPSSKADFDSHKGRWPANVVLTHSPDCQLIGYRDESYQINRFTDGAKPFGDGAGHEFESEEMESGTPVWDCVDGCPVKELDRQSGHLKSGALRGVYKKWGNGIIYGTGTEVYQERHADSGGASRFFHQSFYYQAKAGVKERNAGLKEFDLIGGKAGEITVRGNTNPVCQKCGREKIDRLGRGINCTCKNPEYIARNNPVRNPHPTVKPIALTRHLATLLLPPEAYKPRRLLVPFAGTASEMIGAFQAGWECVIGVEKEREYVDIGRARLQHWLEQGVQLDLFGA